MALKIIQVLKRKQKTKQNRNTPTRQTMSQLFQKDSRTWLQETPHMRSTCRPARSSCCLQVTICGSHTWSCKSGCTQWTISTSHYWSNYLCFWPPQCSVCWDYVMMGWKKKGFFFYRMLNFKSAGCFTQHLLALEQSFPLLCLIFSWPSLF